MARPKKAFATKAERVAHEARLTKRRAKNAEERAARAISEAAEGDADFEELARNRRNSLTNSRLAIQARNGGIASPKRISAARENLTLAFDLMGGVPALVRWGKKNPTEFYRLWSRLIPKESVELSAQLPLEALLSKLSGHEGMSVMDAAHQVGNDMMQEARHRVIEQDAEYAAQGLPSPEFDMYDEETL